MRGRRTAVRGYTLQYMIGAPPKLLLCLLRWGVFISSPAGRSWTWSSLSQAAKWRALIRRCELYWTTAAAFRYHWTVPWQVRPNQFWTVYEREVKNFMGTLKFSARGWKWTSVVSAARGSAAAEGRGDARKDRSGNAGCQCCERVQYCNWPSAIYEMNPSHPFNKNMRELVSNF